MIRELRNFRLTDLEDVEFAQHWLNDHSKQLIINLTGFRPEQLLILIKAELLWNKRKDLLKRMTARYAKLHRQWEWEFIEKIITGESSYDTIEYLREED